MVSAIERELLDIPEEDSKSFYYITYVQMLQEAFDSHNIKDPIMVGRYFYAPRDEGASRREVLSSLNHSLFEAKVRLPHLS